MTSELARIGLTLLRSDSIRMRARLWPIFGTMLVVALSATGCGSGGEGEDDVDGASSDESVERLRYTREFVFVGSAEGEPVVVPFSFRAVDGDEEIDRAAVAWLGRGATWDRFLEESHTSSPVGGVWRIVPQNDLVVIAGGATQIEALRFEREGRRLRLEIGEPETPWIEAGDRRFRLLEGSVTIGSEGSEGSLFEILDVDRTEADGWPPSREFDALFLTSGDSIHLVVSEGLQGDEPGTSNAWIRTRSGEATSSAAEVRWLEMRPLDDARRDIPNSWSFRVPELGLEGEVEAVGYDVLFGPERGGRRAVEIRFSVVGWYEGESGRRDVIGTVRHIQQ